MKKNILVGIFLLRRMTFSNKCNETRKHFEPHCLRKGWSKNIQKTPMLISLSGNTRSAKNEKNAVNCAHLIFIGWFVLIDHDNA